MNIEEKLEALESRIVVLEDIINNGKLKCPKCDRFVYPHELMHRPDPCRSALHGDDEIVVQCEDCYDASSQAI